jgi:hypothetical protein
MVEDHQIRFGRRDHRAYFVDLALASIGLWVGTLPPTAHLRHNHSASRFSQQADLSQLIVEIKLTEVKLNDHRAFTGGGSFNHGRFRE